MLLPLTKSEAGLAKTRWSHRSQRAFPNVRLGSINNVIFHLKIGPDQGVRQWCPDVSLGDPIDLLVGMFLVARLIAGWCWHDFPVMGLTYHGNADAIIGVMATSMPICQAEVSSLARRGFLVAKHGLSPSLTSFGLDPCS